MAACVSGQMEQPQRMFRTYEYGFTTLKAQINRYRVTHHVSEKRFHLSRVRQTVASRKLVVPFFDNRIGIGNPFRVEFMACDPGACFFKAALPPK